MSMNLYFSEIEIKRTIRLECIVILSIRTKNLINVSILTKIGGVKEDFMSTSKVPISAEAPTAAYLLETLFKSTHHIHLHFEAYLFAQDIPAYLTGPRMRFLKEVSDAGKIRMSDLAAKLGIKARTVTQFVDALEQLDILVRIPDPDDRRAILVQITDTAAPIIKKAGEAMNEAAEQLMASLSSERRSQLLDLLHQLADVKGLNCNTDDD
jgi:DNA-binding MarR family transcriptional regulator